MPEGQKKASAEGQSPPQELKEGPRSGRHLLVHIITDHKEAFNDRFIAGDRGLNKWNNTSHSK